MKYLIGLLLSVFVATAQAEVLEVEIVNIIGPATLDLVKRVEVRAERDKAEAILFLVNTPGGSLDTTRAIVQEILNSKIPFLCLVSPSGGHAGSAGAIILQACHVNGALIGTNLGAATPVAGGGQEIPKDLRQKIMNDTRSWLDSLTRLRGRNEKFGQDIILEAKAVSAEDAYKLKAIDWVGSSKADFLKFAASKKIKLNGKESVSINTDVVKTFELDQRYKISSILMDPEFSYMMLLASLALIYFEVTHTGTILPGVLGSLGLIISLIALNKLEVEWGGVLLILLGLGMLIAEMFLPTFGILGVGGVVAFALGSVFLFDPVKTGGYQLPLTLILPVVAVFAGCIVGVSVMMLRTRRVKKKGGYEDLMGELAVVVSREQVELRGEIWKFRSQHEVNPGDQVRVVGHEGLVLNVERK
jgi:membrane-bound serine protease (ClpP class)